MFLGRVMELIIDVRCTLLYTDGVKGSALLLRFIFHGYLLFLLEENNKKFCRQAVNEILKIIHLLSMN